MCDESARYYWGKTRVGGDGLVFMEWVGPITEDEMENEYPEYRHNKRTGLPPNTKESL